MSSSSSSPSSAAAAKPESTPTADARVPLGIMAGTWAFLMGVISAILLAISYFGQTGNVEQTWSIGLYLLGASALLALFAYIDVVSLDRGQRAAVKTD